MKILKSNSNTNREIVGHRPDCPAFHPLPSARTSQRRTRYVTWGLQSAGAGMARRLRAQLPDSAARRSLLGLSSELQTMIARHLEVGALRNLRRTNKSLSDAAAASVQHISVTSGDELEQALTAYKQGDY